MTTSLVSALEVPASAVRKRQKLQTESSDMETQLRPRGSYPDPRWQNEPSRYSHLRDHKFKYISKISNKLREDLEWQDAVKEYSEKFHHSTGSWEALNRYLYPLSEDTALHVNPLETIIKLIAKHGAATSKDQMKEPSLAGCFLRMIEHLNQDKSLRERIKQELIEELASQTYFGTPGSEEPKDHTFSKSLLLEAMRKNFRETGSADGYEVSISASSSETIKRGYSSRSSGISRKEVIDERHSEETYKLESLKTKVKDEEETIETETTTTNRTIYTCTFSDCQDLTWSERKEYALHLAIHQISFPECGVREREMDEKDHATHIKTKGHQACEILQENIFELVESTEKAANENSGVSFAGDGKPDDSESAPLKNEYTEEQDDSEDKISKYRGLYLLLRLLLSYKLVAGLRQKTSRTSLFAKAEDNLINNNTSYGRAESPGKAANNGPSAVSNNRDFYRDNLSTKNASEQSRTSKRRAKDADDEGRDGDEKPPSKRAKKDALRSFGCQLACPFAKAEPTKYLGCLLINRKNLAGVKEHLRRNHFKNHLPDKIRPMRTWGEVFDSCITYWHPKARPDPYFDNLEIFVNLYKWDQTPLSAPLSYRRLNDESTHEETGYSVASILNIKEIDSASHSGEPSLNEGISDLTSNSDSSSLFQGQPFSLQSSEFGLPLASDPTSNPWMTSSETTSNWGISENLNNAVGEMAYPELPWPQPLDFNFTNEFYHSGSVEYFQSNFDINMNLPPLELCSSLSYAMDPKGTVFTFGEDGTPDILPKYLDTQALIVDDLTGICDLGPEPCAIALPDDSIVDSLSDYSTWQYGANTITTGGSESCWDETELLENFGRSDKPGHKRN